MCQSELVRRSGKRDERLTLFAEIVAGEVSLPLFASCPPPGYVCCRGIVGCNSADLPLVQVEASTAIVATMGGDTQA